jgi:hypothetical protein
MSQYGVVLNRDKGKAENSSEALPEAQRYSCV